MHCNSFFLLNFAPAKAQMAESVDALVSNTSGETHPGSSPGLGTAKGGFFQSALHNKTNEGLGQPNAMDATLTVKPLYI